MTNTNSNNQDSHFPKSVFYASRKEFYPNLLNLNLIEGELPQDIYGHLFLVAPVGLATNQPDEKGWIRLAEDGTPLFNGDGMVYRLDFDEVNQGKVKLASRMAQTPCFYTDEMLHKAEDRNDIRKYINLGMARLSLDLGFRNQINTAIIPMKFSEAEGYRLMMTWDAGRPYEIDPETLEVVTAVGSNQEWDEQIDLQQILEVVNTASHPAFDPYSENGAELFTVSFQKSIQTWLKLLKKSRSIEEIRSELKRIKDTVTVLDSKVFSLLRKREAKTSTTEPQEMKLNELPESYQQVVRECETELQNTPSERGEVVLSNFQEIEEIFKTIVWRLEWITESLLEALTMEDYVKLIRWDGRNSQDGQGSFQIWRIDQEDGTSIKIPDSMHQIAATRDYLVLANTVFKVGPEQLLPNLLPTKLQNLPWFLKNPLNKSLNWLNDQLRDIFSYQQPDSTDLYIIRRSDLDPKKSRITAKQISIPRPFPHFVADYENPGDRITLHVAHNTGWDASSWVRPYDKLATKERIDPEDFPLGMTSGSTDLNSLGSYVIDLQDWDNPDKERVALKGNLLSDKKLTWMSAIATYHLAEGINLPKTFKNIYWLSWGCWSDLLTDYVVDLYQDYPHRETTINELLEITRQGVPTSICRVDLEQGEIVDSYQFESNVFANSPQFVPRSPSNETVDESIDGYIVCVVNTGDSEKTPSEFQIFDAANLKGGAICKLSHEDLKLGMTLHSAWCPKINRRVSKYQVKAQDDYQEILTELENSGQSENAVFFQEILDRYFAEGLLRSK
ncbi:MAG TPA: carotenoid oxygenase family protein [Xenococcaceae cyanobacterium]